MEDKSTNVCQEDTYKKLFYQHAEKLFRFLLLKFNNEDLARDAMQEAFIVLWENCQKVTLNNAKSYVFTVARNRAIDSIRKEKLHLRIVEEDKIIITDELLEDNSDQLKKMNFILSKLPEGSKEVFLMNRIHEMTYAEIAKELDISVKAVEKRMSVALKIIREN
ncbi:MAG: sigma-70 family RNA polymerase sigma factor [Spirosomaceae bacterium]|nr:sigma-70 family RNA polymerase sigma factor [Spirosomataceae bacterium]